MDTVRRWATLALGLALTGCVDDRSALEPEPGSPVLAAEQSSGVVVQVKGTAAGFSVEGPITCISTAGNQAWVGGTVGSIDSPDPEDQELVGVDMWWRSIDNGQGDQATLDITTGIGFAFPGSTITAESWCRDQPALLVLREVDPGSNLKIKVR
jgi:hypothetical protein